MSVLSPAPVAAAAPVRPAVPGAAPVPLYLRHRPADGDPALRGLLLHGLAGSGTVWDGLAEHGPAGLEAWTAELPWRAEHVSPWGQQEHDTVGVPAALDLVPGGAHLVVAHSFSANLLLEFLGTQVAGGADPVGQYGIRGIVLVSPFYRRRAGDFAWDAAAGLQETFLRLMEEGIRNRPGRPIDPGLRHQMARRVCERVGPHGWLKFFQTYLRTPVLRTDLITVPCLVVTGSEDFAAAESAMLAADLPEAELRVLPGQGHYPMAEDPALFSALLDEFILRSM
ncbi:alpha/beta fold hydrolase [Streptomyces sp. cmx-4-9]|uniref:alpha/beta fold hydrolase n=1 Tax=Streptomyces sp. cmx-4-9 TaxID=2790941 RepID=UPI0039810277